MSPSRSKGEMMGSWIKQYIILNISWFLNNTNWERIPLIQYLFIALIWVSEVEVAEISSLGCWSLCRLCIYSFYLSMYRDAKWATENTARILFHLIFGRKMLTMAALEPVLQTTVSEPPNGFPALVIFCLGQPKFTQYREAIAELRTIRPTALKISLSFASLHTASTS